MINIACELGKASSIIATILKKEEIKAFDFANGVTLIASKEKRPEIRDEVEKLLLIWINEKQLPCDSIKAWALHDDILPITLGTSAEVKGLFVAS